MTINIYNEAISQGRDSLNIDNLKNTYVVKDLNFIFKSPFFGYFENQKDFLKSRSVIVLMEPKYYRKPEYLSYDKYGSVVLAPLIMFLNNVYSRIDFTIDKIYVPTMEAITHVIVSAYEFFGQKIEVSSIEIIKTRNVR